MGTVALITFGWIETLFLKFIYVEKQYANPKKKAPLFVSE